MLGSPGQVTEENLLSILRRPMGDNNIQSDDTNAYDELKSLEEKLEGTETHSIPITL